MSESTVRSELAAAVRSVNAAYYRLDPDEQNRVHLACDRPLDEALLDGDRAKALAQIEAWRDRQLADIAEAMK
jgi:hypothetical protein